MYFGVFWPGFVPFTAGGRRNGGGVFGKSKLRKC